MTPQSRLRADVATIRTEGDQTGAKSGRELRWIGVPQGWRRMGDLANDIEELLEERERMLDVMEDALGFLAGDLVDFDPADLMIRIEEFTDGRSGAEVREGSGNVDAGSSEASREPEPEAIRHPDLPSDHRDEKSDAAPNTSRGEPSDHLEDRSDYPPGYGHFSGF